MSHTRWLGCALLATLVGYGCSGRRLPPGTPPPEYEPPVVAPWTPESAEARPDSAPPSSAGAPNATPAEPATDLSLDAGPR